MLELLKINNFKNRIYRAHQWESLKKLATSRVYKSTYFWFAAVPIVVTVFNKIKTETDIEVFGQPHTIVLQLPFSWQLFFFGSFLIVLAEILFNSFCPEIIRKYDTFHDFEITGQGSYELKRLVEEVVKSKASGPEFPEDFGAEFKKVASAAQIELIIEFGKRFCTPHPHSWDSCYHLDLNSVIKNLRTSPAIPSSNLPSAFWYLRNAFDHPSQIWRIICAVFFRSGQLAFAYVAYQNVAKVASYAVEFWF